MNDSTAASFDYVARRDSLWRRVSSLETQPDCLLVSNLVNIRYLTGFTGSAAFLLLTGDRTVFLTDGRYIEQVATECPGLETRIRPVDSSMMALICESIFESKSKACMIESDSMTRAFYRDLSSGLGGQVELLDSTGLVETLRSKKDSAELNLIRKSVEINEAALLSTLEKMQRSWTELDFAWQLEREIRERGGAGFSFEPIVAAGPAAARPHYHAGATRLFEHQFFLVDWGTEYKGYASDLTRMVCIGSVPEKILEIHGIVAEAKKAAAATLKAGVELKTVDAAARSVIKDAGYGDQFNHGLGHGFGLEIHETPFMSPAFDGTFVEGVAVTIEPGIYLPGIGGVRLEDDFVVTEAGCEKLNALPDDFLVAKID
jgi:Xaa-Pro aminopeptidase